MECSRVMSIEYKSRVYRYWKSMYKTRGKKPVFKEVLLNKMEEMQMDMKAMTIHNEKINEENAKKGWMHMKRR